MNNFKKPILLLYIVLSALTAQVNAQCGNRKKVPKEFVTNRLSGEVDLYGHPYTIFNKRVDDAYTAVNMNEP